MNWIKDYSVEDNLALYWHVSKPTFRNNAQDTLRYLSANLDEVPRSFSPSYPFQFQKKTIKIYFTQ